MDHLSSSIIGLDVGDKRIGVAIAHLSAAFPRPLTTLQQSDTIIAEIVELCARESIAAVVVGLPRSLNGEDTAQTAKARSFYAELEAALEVPVYWSDEAVTSRMAEAELQARGKQYKKGEVDALAATFILEDFIKERLHKESFDKD